MERLRGWDDEPRAEEIAHLGEKCPDEFFRIVVESLSDSFSARDAKVYERCMSPWVQRAERVDSQQAPKSVERAYVLSRVTLGADIKVTSVILDGLKKKYPSAEIWFVGARKCAELFAADPRIGWLELNYPRSGSPGTRLHVVDELRRSVQSREAIVVDPDSRITQLGLALPCDPRQYFHFPSRTFMPGSTAGLSELCRQWMLETFGVNGTAYVAQNANVRLGTPHPRVAVSLGVGENESKRIGGRFESDLLRQLAFRYACLCMDRGAGGEERARVEEAVAASEIQHAGVHVEFFDGSFADFVDVIRESQAYVGYDSAGQHAAAALGVPLTTIFKGASNERFRMRWSPEGSGPIRMINADQLSPAEVLRELSRGE